jgi:serine protease
MSMQFTSMVLMLRLKLCGALVVAGLAAGELHGLAQSPPAPHSLLAPKAVVTSRVVKAWNERRPYVPGEVLVKFHDGVGAAAQSRALSALRGGIIGSESVWIGDTLLARTPSELDMESAAGVLARQREVEWAQPNYLRTLHTIPNDPSYTRQWNLQMIDAPRAWDINPGGTSDVVVAVLDSGVTTTATTFPMMLWTGDGFEQVGIPVTTSPDIATSRILPGRDFVFWSGPVVDFVGHGTHIAGTVLQETNNAFGLSGIAYRARLMPLKVCYGYWEIQFAQSAAGIPGFVDPRETGSCPDSAVSEAIRYAVDNGAHVINLSLGGPEPSPIAREALQYAVSRGVFVAVSNGNQYERGNPIEYPAADAAELNGVVSVGAVGRTGRRSFYSSTGSHLEVMAPGGDARDGGVAGSIFQVSLLTTEFDPETVAIPRFDRYVEVPMQGTSMATPHVAGLAALLYSQGIRNPAAIEAALRRFARDAGAPGRDDEYGDGVIDARAALRGFGLAR